MITQSTPADESPSARFGGMPLPRGLREDAATMLWSTFTSTYSPSSGPLRLGRWHAAAHSPATSPGPRPTLFEAMLAIGDRIETASAAATGPVAALTAMLYDEGISLEVLRFHQLESAAVIATFIQGSDGRHVQWAMGLSEDRTQSALRAVIACANRLLRSVAQAQ